jgi:hypothetical protein
MCKEELAVVFEYGTFSAGFALEAIQTVLTRHSVSLNGFALYEQPMSFASVRSRLERSQRQSFNLTGPGFEFHLGSVRNSRLVLFSIKSSVPSAISWDEWAAQFTDAPKFVMGWVVDSNYDYWQNAEDPLQFTAAGKTYEHFKMKSNGLPYPVERTIIDTSANPGRRLFRDGYIEAVGAVMWLGESFWSLTGADQQQVVKTQWLRCSNPAPAVTRLQAADHCFTMSEGDSSALQSRLRSLLFPTHCRSLATTG